MATTLPSKPASGANWDAYGAALDAIIRELQTLQAAITANPVPVAAFTGTPLTGAAGVSVQFTQTSSGDPKAFAWDFGDGTKSTEENPAHVYSAGGTYTVSLTVTGSGGSDIEIKANYVSVTVPTSASKATVTATPGDGFVKLDIGTYPGTNVFKVGRDGVDNTGYGAYETIVTGNTWTALQLNNGTAYHLYVIPQINNADGPRTDVTATPVAGSSTTVPSNTGRVVPLVGRSGLPWNSIVFGHTNNLASTEAWRGRPFDGWMHFPYRLTLDGMKPGSLATRRTGDLVVWAIPAFVQGSGQSNQSVASGAQDGQIANLAQNMASVGWNTPLTVIRLGWENNGNWYEWSQDRPGGSAAFAASFRRFVQVFRANGMDKCLFDWNLNKGPQSYNSGVSWTTGYPGDDVVDVIGLDTYDSYTKQVDEASWRANTVGKNPGLEDVLAFVKQRGKLMAIDEWGVCNDPSGGYDNPWYIARMFQWLKTNASYVAWEVLYDDNGAPSTLRHKLSDGQNPNAAAQYKKPYPNGWGA